MDDYEASGVFLARYGSFVYTPKLRAFLTELAESIRDDKVRELLTLIDEESSFRDWNAHFEDGEYA